MCRTESRLQAAHSGPNASPFTCVHHFLVLFDYLPRPTVAIDATERERRGEHGPAMDPIADVSFAIFGISHERPGISQELP